MMATGVGISATGSGVASTLGTGTTAGLVCCWATKSVMSDSTPAALSACSPEAATAAGMGGISPVQPAGASSTGVAGGSSSPLMIRER